MVTLHILPRTEVRGQHLPLDFFLEALAREQKSQAIGVVLSGTASDGTHGLSAIKAEGGITLVQDPETAHYDGMPRSAIASGAVDLILSPKRIAEELIRIAQHPDVFTETSQPVKLDQEQAAQTDQNLAKVFSLLRNSANADFTNYKHSTIQRRIERRMFLQKTEDLGKYVHYLETHPDEIRALFSDILIHVTSFFRDPKVFELLKTQILPHYMKNRDRPLPFRIWVPGCSTGEEAYSIAMTFIEYLDDSQTPKAGIPLSIFATDLSESALQTARKAIYPRSIDKKVSKERLERFFEQTKDGRYKIAKWLRDTCLFSRHDITRDTPFAKIDLISCRNVLIYFDSVLQKRVIPIFHYALNPNGILLLGHSETINRFSELFTPLNKDIKAYSKNQITTPPKLHFPAGRYSIEKVQAGHKTPETLLNPLDLQRESEKIALLKYAPPHVVVSDALNVVQSRGRLSPFLELSSGQFSPNLLRMAHPELAADLKMLLQSSRKESTPVTKEGVLIHDGDTIRTITICVIPIPPSPANIRCKDRYFTVFFEETNKNNLTDSNLTQGLKDRRDLETQRKLSASQDYQQTLIEQYETSQEELISANEELQSTNEELQSTNEELETAKEELQSGNEELTTINDEMQTQNTAITILNSDLTNLLSSVDMPIVMVSRDYRIRRFTPKAAQFLNLISSDMGRPIGHLRPNIQGLDLEAMISQAIHSHQVWKLEIQDRDNHWYLVQVSPYRTADNQVDGAVIALQDINQLKIAAIELKRAADDANVIIQAQPLPLLVLSTQYTVTIVNQAFCEKFKLPRSKIEGKLISEISEGEWNFKGLPERLEQALRQDTPVASLKLAHYFPAIGQREILINASKVRLAGSSEFAILLGIEDLTDQLEAARITKEAEDKYRATVENALDSIVIADQDGKIEFANQRVEQVFGYSPKELIGQPIEVLVPDRLRSIHVNHREKYLAHPSARMMGSNLEVTARRKNGDEFPVDVSLIPLKRKGVTFVTATIRDVSEHKALERERANILVREKEARALAEKANLAKDEFLATLSHELRTPLTAILSWAQMLCTGRLDAEKTRRGNEIVEQSARAQSQLIDDLLDVSRIQAGKLNLTIEEVDPSKIIAAAVESTRSLAAMKSIQIETQIDSSVKTIFADPTRLQQILWNLITNSIKFSSQGGKVWIKLEQRPACSDQPRKEELSCERVCIEVRDNGKGIKSEFLPVIFERFTQVDSTSTRAYGGLGLGLAIVRNLVEMHHGTVSVQSPGEGKGATFTICLPVHPTTKVSLAETEAEAETESNVTLHGLKLLIVDDEPNAREVFSVMLQELGAEVKTAESASQALATLQEFKPDVLVSDIAMPFEDGYSLIEKVRALKSECAKTPALALTAYASREDIQQTHLAGFQSHVAKPVDAKKLALAIARLAGRK